MAKTNGPVLVAGLVYRAIQFASMWHKDQKRKYTGEPYLVHLASVAHLVSLVTDDERMIAAAWLHDAVEDTDATLNQIRISFGEEVANLVDWLTDASAPTDGNRAARKEIDRLHIADASRDAQTIKLADLIDNTRSIVRYDQNFAVVYLKEKERLLGVLTRGDERMHNAATRSLVEARNTLPKQKD